MTVITVSRQVGSRAEEIVEQVCRALGYHPFGKAQITRAAFEAGLSNADGVDFSEDNYKMQGFFDRLFGRPSRVGQVHVWKGDVPGHIEVGNIDLDEVTALALVRTAVNEAYQTGNMVIVGRGGQAILEGLVNVVHVRIEAEMEDRIQWIKNQLKTERQEYGSNVEVRREAQDFIAKRDAASADYIRRFYNLDWSDPALYDLILNTSRISVEKAVEQIAERVREHEVRLVG